jgi:hypothetical protein
MNDIVIAGAHSGGSKSQNAKTDHDGLQWEIFHGSPLLSIFGIGL